jgi:hypothetical protein
VTGPDDLDIARLHGPIRPLDPAELADHGAVCQLARTYALGIDLRDEALVRSVFAPGARIQGVLRSATADEYIPDLLAGVAPYAATMHSITNQYVTLDGDTATAWSYAVAVHVEEPDTGRDDMAMGVHYRDRAVRGAAGWSIVARHTVIQWVRGPFPRPPS